MGLLTIFLVYIVKLQSCHFVEKKKIARDPKSKSNGRMIYLNPITCSSYRNYVLARGVCVGDEPLLFVTASSFEFARGYF